MNTDLHGGHTLWVSADSSKITIRVFPCCSVGGVVPCWSVARVVPCCSVARVVPWLVLFGGSWLRFNFRGGVIPVHGLSRTHRDVCEMRGSCRLMANANGWVWGLSATGAGGPVFKMRPGPLAAR